MLEALQHKEEINERLLSVVMPHLIQGFKSRCVEYRASCCMVLSQLASVARLKESLLVSLLPVVTKVSFQRSRVIQFKVMCDPPQEPRKSLEPILRTNSCDVIFCFGRNSRQNRMIVMDSNKAFSMSDR